MASAVVGALRVLLTGDTVQFEKSMVGADATMQKLANTMKRDLIPTQTRINSLVRAFAGTKEIGDAREYAAAVHKIGGVTQLVAADQVRVNKAMQEAIAHYRAIGKEAPMWMTKLADATKQVQAPTKGIGGDIDGLIGKAKALAGVFGVTLGAGALAGFISKTFEAADQIGTLATKMGVSVEAAQRFQYAARQSGAQIEDVSKAIVSMNDKLASGDKSTITALSLAGLKFQDIRAMKPEDAFRTIADAIGRIPDPMLQAKVAMDLFGKSGAELLPMIREGSLKASDAIQVMSDETVKSLKDAKQAWENFWNDLTVLSGNAISKMLPQWKEFLRDFKTGATALAKFVETFNKTGRVDIAAGAAFGSGLLDHLSDEQKARIKALAGFAGTGDAQEVGGFGGGILNFSGASTPSGTTRRDPSFVEALKVAEEAASRLTRAELKQIEAAKLLGTSEADLMVKYNLTAEAMKAVERRLTAMNSASKEAQSEAEKLRDKYLAWERALLGLSDAQREQLDFQMQAITRGHLPHVAALLKVESAVKSVTGATTIAGKELQKFLAVVPAQMLNVPMGNTAQLLAAIDKSNLLRGIRTDAGSLGLWGPTPAQIKDVEKLNKQFGVASELLRAVASSAQGAFGKVMTGIVGATDAIFQYAIATKAAKLNNDALAMSAAGLSLAMAGATLGISAVIGAIASQAAWDEEYKAKLEAIRERAKALGLTLEELTAISEKWRKEARISVGDRFRGDMSRRDVLDFIEGVQAKIESLAGALDAFGGKVPASLRPMVKELLQMNGLTADMRKQLEGLMGAPAWQKAAERAQALGVDPSSLGSGFNQARIQDTAFSLLHDIQLFEEFNKNVQDFLPGMADELSALAKEAIKTGAALPKTLEPYIRQLDAMGLLLDENGNRIEMGALSFKDIEDEALKAVVDVLKQIRDLLANQLPDAARQFSRGLSGLGGVSIGLPKFVQDEQLHMQMPSLGDNWQAYAGASYAGPGSLPSADTNINLYVSDIVSFEQFLSQRGGAEAVVRTIPNVIERWRGN